MEILLGENGQLGAFPDLLFEYFQIICPWKYYGAKTDLLICPQSPFNISMEILKKANLEILISRQGWST